ncbi:MULTISPECIES: FAD-dependent oxidoreductase [unclassified Mycolicibacterium]|uniref:FAD-dependent oxidoreductase n=1 Tax=unclassified Mycolicibacterium TaxID=2636767 RepID=UPI002EDAF8FA
MKVAIIGAGLAGLALAHGLRRRGVDVVVFERNAGAADHPASYGIHLNADGLTALHACLPPANWAALDSVSVATPDVLRFRDRNLRPVLAVDLAASTRIDPISHRRAVSRDALHAALLLGIDESVVQWGRTFVGFDHLDGSGVQVQFADGDPVVADVVVGADGANSRVRAQRLPDLKRVDLGILNVAGRTPLTRELIEVLPTGLVDGSVNNVVPLGAGWMFVSTWAPREIDPRSDDGARLIVWAWAAAASAYPADIDSWDGARLRQWVGARIEGWAPGLRAVVDASDPACVGPVALKSMPELPSWTPNAVTLIGDAIHNMTPMAGIGANTALRDADLLCRRLTDTGDSPLHVRIGDYEAQMREYANVALARSTRNARNATTSRRAERLMFHGLLRTASKVPALTRAMFGADAIGCRDAAAADGVSRCV